MITCSQVLFEHYVNNGFALQGRGVYLSVSTFNMIICLSAESILTI